ncbi:LysR family transcriptional regulator [Guggenheimella bovis]
MSKVSKKVAENRISDKINIDHVMYFVEFCKHMSFTQAAEVLGISQPGLSRAIKSLEQRFQCKLVDRTGRRLRLTSEGKQLYDYGSNLLKQLDLDLLKLDDLIIGESGSVRFGIPDIQGSIFLPGLFTRFTESHPSIHLELVEIPGESIKEEILKGSIDLGLIMLDFEHPTKSDDEVELLEIFRSKHVLAVSKDHPLASKKSVSIKDLKDESFLLLSEDFTIHDHILRLCKKAGFDPNVKVTSSQWNFLIELVGLNYGVTILPSLLLKRFASDDVKMIELKDPVFPWITGLMMLKNNYRSKAFSAFYEELIKESKMWGKR